MKVHKIKIPLYYGELHVIISDDFTKHAKLDKSVNDYKAISTPVGDSRWAIFINPLHIDDHSLIAHEALHIVGYVFSSIKCKMDLDNDEPQCYLLGWIVNQVYIAVNKYKSLRKAV